MNYLTGGEYDASGRPVFGWVEKDGELGDNTGPTSSEETVVVGQLLDVGVVVNLNPCFRWSVCRTRVLQTWNWDPLTQESSDPETQLTR